MNNLDEKDNGCCQEETCHGVESCDCQGICTCEPEDIDFDDAQDDCDACCCGDDDDDDDDECDDDDMDCENQN
ncbi:MAG: hypothetical protein Q8Q60_04500 [Candidatus Chromulinivorax sp.]|nr:hypothetical protein [Candidatus Chromulinivorax sp.]